jgi:hypothetical protein
VISNRRRAFRVRRWAADVGLASGIVVAAAVFGSTCGPVARADSPEDVLGQAAADLTQAASVLHSAPTGELGAASAELLTAQELLATQADPDLTQISAFQEGLSADDQTFLANADEQFVTAAQNLLSADQAFVAADQAGQLSGSGLLPADLAVIEADLGLLPATWDVTSASLLAFVDPDIGALFSF